MRGAPSVINLSFHGIGTPPSSLSNDEREYWISRSLFQHVLDLVAGRADVELSFDDGNLSDVEVGLPALKERGLTASFFPVLGWLELPGHVNADHVKMLHDAGMPLGIHGMTHQPWRGSAADDLGRELEGARDVLHGITDEPVTAAACPLGAYDRRVLSVLRRRGFTTVFTSDRVQAWRGAWVQPRFSIRCHDDIESLRRILRPVPGLRDRARGVALLAFRRSV